MPINNDLKIALFETFISKHLGDKQVIKGKEKMNVSKIIRHDMHSGRYLRFMFDLIILYSSLVSLYQGRVI